MRSAILFAAASAALLSSAAAAAPAPGAAGGAAAPAFELPALEGGRFVSSASLFRDHQMTFVIFWDGECPSCVESLRQCQIFYDRVEGGDMTVVGINVDAGDDLAVRGVVAASGVTFPQLRDRDGAAAAAWGVPASTFAVFLVDREGMIADRRIDPEGPIPALMELMLLGGSGTGSAGAEEPEARPSSHDAGVCAGLLVRGDARVKFLSVDASGDGATGPYGERLEPGNSLLQRFELEASMRVGRHLRAGGLLRAGTEGIAVLRAGPQYFDSERGSVFASIEAGPLTARLGYFTMHMTPLTMMRWDWNDNPRTGGDAGCGCGATAGILIVESLEELGPDLTFEGATAGWSRGEFEADLFYAMPRRARDTRAVVWQYGGEEQAAYPLEIYGMQAKWRRHDRRTGRFWGAGVHLLGHREDSGAIDPVDLGYAPFEHHEGEILTADAEIPLLPAVSLEGEWIALCRDAGGNLGPGHDERAERDGSGGILGLAAAREGLLDLRFEYLRLSSGFYSPFAALSYEAGRHGMRASAIVRLPGGWSALSLFYKRLREIDVPEPGAERGELSFAGATFDIDHPAGPGGSISWLDRGEWRGGDMLGRDESRRTLTASVRHRFGRFAWIEAMYQRTDAEDALHGPTSRTDIFSVYLRAEF
ncbi:MAG: TlpA disulfide reductase family protein [Candidatus Krumholzibacteria bacterium]|nr:TlpA disulfide reductase family protein [Candidatus Krumholzibacteria bacterium]